MSFSEVVRWGGIAAQVGALLFILADLALFVFSASQGSPEGLFWRSVVSGSAGVLLGLGLVSLYARRLEAVGYLGLVGFLAAFIGLWFGHQNIGWAAFLANLGWALFGVAILGAKAYPRTPTIVLIAGAVLAGVVNLLLASIRPGIVAGMYVAILGAIAEIIFYVGVGWLGFALFSGREEDTRRAATAAPPRVR